MNELAYINFRNPETKVDSERKKTAMKKKPIILLLLICFTLPVFSQDKGLSESRVFLKRIELNYVNDWEDILPDKKRGFYNFNSKTDIEKLFWGDFNSPVEFFIAPSFEGAYGFRLHKETTGSYYVLETKRIVNRDEVFRELSEKYPLQSDNSSKEAGELSVKHNREMLAKQNEESTQLFKTDTKTIQVTELFANKLNSTIINAIESFKGKGRPPVILDGYTTTFRCVVDDELWTFVIHNPNGYIKQLSDICVEITNDINKNSFNESGYIELLDSLR